MLWTIIKFLIYTWLISVVFRQTFNFIFVTWRKPIVWILLVSTLSVAHIALAFAMGWDPRLVSGAVLLAFLLNLPPPMPKSFARDEFRNLVDDSYRNLGIKRGLLKHRIGLILLLICSFGTYAVLFGEVCQLHGECELLFQRIFY